MKTSLFKLVISCLCIPFISFANNDATGRFTKEKKIKKEFNVNTDALLKVKNSYGNLYMTSWNENKIVIEVHIKTNGDNEKKVQQKLDEIDVEFEANSNLVAAKTIFSKNRWGWNWGKTNNINIQVNYTIKLPLTNRVDLTNDYGGIYLDKLKGKALINCDYGKMEIGELLSRGNVLKFDYTSKTVIDYVKGASIYADYSNYTIGKSENLIIKADYTNSRINKAGNIEYNCDYGSMKADELKNIQGKASYLKTVFGKVTGDVIINSDFSSISIKELATNAGNVNIRSEYAGIKIGFAPDYNFNFDIRLNYAGLKYSELEFKIKRSDNQQSYYEGHYGSENSKNNISIHSEYGGVSLKKL
jgi:hypothetical protein